MAKSKSKPCDLCSNLVYLRYRVQYDASEIWVLVCRSCWDRISRDNPLYRYGGTWKAKK